MFGSSVPVCAENRLRWNLSPEQIQQLTDELIGSTKRVYDQVGALDLQGVSFQNTLKALADAEVEYTGETVRDVLGPTRFSGSDQTLKQWDRNLRRSQNQGPVLGQNQVRQ